MAVEPELFPAGWKMLPIYAWRAFTSPAASITSTVANPRPLTDIGTNVIAIFWYQSPPGAPVILRATDYGDSRPYTFRMPDGTTRVNSSPMLANTYSTLVAGFLRDDTYPV